MMITDGCVCARKWRKLVSELPANPICAFPEVLVGPQLSTSFESEVDEAALTKYPPSPPERSATRVGPKRSQRVLSSPSSLAVRPGLLRSLSSRVCPWGSHRRGAPAGLGRARHLVCGGTAMSLPLHAGVGRMQTLHDRTPHVYTGERTANRRRHTAVVWSAPIVRCARFPPGRTPPGTLGRSPRTKRILCCDKSSWADCGFSTATRRTMAQGGRSGSVGCMRFAAHRRGHVPRGRRFWAPVGLRTMSSDRVTAGMRWGHAR